MPLIMNADVEELDGLAPRACELCHKKEGASRCSACQAVYYCGRECQADDRHLHKMPCNLIKRALRRYELEEKKLRELRGGFLTPENVFENYVGRFWGVVETRAYMRARFEVVDAMLLSYGTAGGPVDVVQTVLHHLLDMMRLCRCDNMGVRQLIPALYIRLGRDQDAYDFTEWYATTALKPDYDWGNMDEPFLDTKDADVLEPLHEGWTGPHLDLSHAVAVTLIKVRIVLDLQAVQGASVALRGVVPEEIIDMIRRRLVGSVVSSRPRILLAGPEETAQLGAKLKTQIRELYKAIEKFNPHFWNLLLTDPDAGVLRRPVGPYTKQSEDEALLTLGYSYAAWYETPGAVDVLWKLGNKGCSCDRSRMKTALGSGQLATEEYSDRASSYLARS